MYEASRGDAPQAPLTVLTILPSIVVLTSTLAVPCLLSILHPCSLFPTCCQSCAVKVGVGGA